MLQAILVIGQYAYCPEFLGNTRFTRFKMAIRVLPKIFGQYAYCPASKAGQSQYCPIHSNQPFKPQPYHQYLVSLSHFSYISGEKQTPQQICLMTWKLLCRRFRPFVFFQITKLEPLQIRRQKWWFRQTELVGYILPRRGYLLPPRFRKGGGEGGDDHYRGSFFRTPPPYILYQILYYFGSG